MRISGKLMPTVRPSRSDQLFPGNPDGTFQMLAIVSGSTVSYLTNHTALNSRCLDDKLHGIHVLRKEPPEQY